MAKQKGITATSLEIICDNDYCNWIAIIDPKDIHKFHNTKCPRCNGDKVLITDKELKSIEKMNTLISNTNKIIDDLDINIENEPIITIKLSSENFR